MKKISLALAFAFSMSIGAANVARADAGADMGEQAITFLEKFAGVIDANKTDCKAMAGALSKFADDNKQFMKDMNDKQAKLTKEQKDQWMQKYKARFDAAMGKMGEGMKKCGGDKDVGEAMKKLK